ncbi:MAG: hypothetical protein NZ844_05510 [Chloroherpetonaceae bacterium]|nr:hypothetical protein [Chloroherpetonaceae bacterium]
MIPNKYTALERLQIFKPVASFGVLRAALIEEIQLGNRLPVEITEENIIAFATEIGFEKCEASDCDLWYNARKAWFMVDAGEKICRMCAVLRGLEPEF